MFRSLRWRRERETVHGGLAQDVGLLSAHAARPHGAAVAGLIAYLAGEVLPHATRENDVLLPAPVIDALSGHFRRRYGLTPDTATAGELHAARDLARTKFTTFGPCRDGTEPVKIAAYRKWRGAG